MNTQAKNAKPEPQAGAKRRGGRNSTQRRQGHRMEQFNAEKTRENGQPNYEGRPDHWYQLSRTGNDNGLEVGKPPKTPVPKPATTESAPKDGKLFEMPDYARLIPDNRYNYNNLDHSGFVELAYDSYKNLNALDSRLGRQISPGAYVHAMNEMLWVRTYNVAEQNGTDVHFDTSRLNAMLDVQNVKVPAEIHEYFKSIGEYTDPGSQRWRVNLPEAAQPGRRRRVANQQLIGGDFGQPTPLNHNAYECYVSPLVTSQVVRMEYGEEDVIPLPHLMPAPVDDGNLIPNRNLLGWIPQPRDATQEAMNRLPDIHWATDEIGSRIQHSPDIWNLVQDILTSLEDKHEMRIGIPIDGKGLPSNMAYVTAVDGDIESISYRTPVVTSCYTQLTASEIGRAVRFTPRRRREEDAPGTCFLRRDAQDVLHVPAGWLETRNANFLRAEPFEVLAGQVNNDQDIRRFHLDTAEDREVCVMNFIRNNFNKKKS